MEENYYLANKQHLLDEFTEMEKYVRQVISIEQPQLDFDTIMRKSVQEFESLLPQLPFIGGKRNRLTRNLVASAMVLALYRILKNRGLSDEEIGKIVYETLQEQVKNRNRVTSSMVTIIFKYVPRDMEI